MLKFRFQSLRDIDSEEGTVKLVDGIIPPPPSFLLLLFIYLFSHF